MSKAPKDEAELFGLLALHDGYFKWCFDEMDGSDHELQYLGLVTAIHVRADEFIEEVLLDYEVADVLKMETLRMLIERNEEMDIGLVLCNIYRRLTLPRITVGRKRRKRFIEGFAKVASKFIVIRDLYGEKLREAAENLYNALAENDGLDMVDNTDDLACAIFLTAGLKELGNNPEMIAGAFEADVVKVGTLLSVAAGTKVDEENKDEID
jgi:hypothetical protein